MVDFGRHALSIWAAYGVAVGLYAGLVFWSWRRARKVTRELLALEGKKNG